MDAVYNDKGEQIPETTPLELPLGYHHPEDIQSMIRRMVTDAAVVAANEAAGLESFEEANDFDVMEEDAVIPSNHEFTEMQEEHYHHDKKQSKISKQSVTEKRSPKATAADSEEEQVRDEKPPAKSKKKVVDEQLEQ